jgi:hypothetical protein
VLADGTCPRNVDCMDPNLGGIHGIHSASLDDLVGPGDLEELDVDLVVDLDDLGDHLDLAMDLGSVAAHHVEEDDSDDLECLDDRHHLETANLGDHLVELVAAHRAEETDCHHPGNRGLGGNEQMLRSKTSTAEAKCQSKQQNAKHLGKRPQKFRSSIGI